MVLSRLLVLLCAAASAAVAHAGARARFYADHREGVLAQVAQDLACAAWLTQN